MDNIIVILCLVLITGGALFFVFRQKKKGVECVGCPDASSCAGKCPGCRENCGSSTK